MEISTIEKSQYPLLLRQISQLPTSMDIIGSLPSDNNKFLCVIGSRINSSYGEDACRRLIRGLKGYPIVIVSGLAVGIDSISHEAAIEAELKTVCFPGSGLATSVLYPRSKIHLARKIVDHGGALLSKFARNQQSENWTFPVRNRLMAGMSHAVLIIEAKKKSGTLITADYATEFGRDILTVPGSIFSELSYGPHMLIRRGATPISSSEDILQSLGFNIMRSDGMQRALPNFAEMSLSPIQHKIIDYLRLESLSSTGIIEKATISSSQFNVAISELELKGIVTVKENKYSIC